jgi:hypothetical protein
MIVGLLMIAVLLSFATPALAALHCVQGTIRPPSRCEAIYDSIYAAQDAAGPRDEVRVFGTTLTPTTVVLKARKLTGHRAVLDARDNPGVVLHVGDLEDVSTFDLDDLTILHPGTADAVGVRFAQLDASAGTTGLVIEGPRGGQGIGVDVIPGAGRVDVKGNVSTSIISGVGVGIRVTDAVGRFSADGMVIRDVKTGLQTTGFYLDGRDHSGLGQIFRSEIACQRPESIGLHEISPALQDHSRLNIHSCSVAVQIECRPGYGCGRGGAYDFLTIATSPCPEAKPGLPAVCSPCVAVRTVQEDGTVLDGHQNDPTCGSNWDAQTTIDAVKITPHATICRKVF